MRTYEDGDSKIRVNSGNNYTIRKKSGFAGDGGRYLHHVLEMVASRLMFSSPFKGAFSLNLREYFLQD